MSEVQVRMLPNVLWKITGVTGFFRIKSPSFTFLGARWKLKFVYCNSDEGHKSFIILKNYGVTIDDVTVYVSTSLNEGIHEYRAKDVEITDLSCRECIIWQELNTDLHPLGSTIISLFQSNYYVLCSFRLYYKTMPSRVPDSTEQQPEAQTSECSPCVASLSHDFGKLFDNPSMSDVILKCRDKKIYAHQIVLSARSEVFAAMFRSGMKEAKDKTVTIEDIEPSVLEQVVRYMYSGDITDLAPGNARKVYAAADKYGVEALMMKCGVLMVENAMKCGVLMVENAEGTIASQTTAAAGESGRVKEGDLSYFAIIKSLFRSHEWKKLSQKNPKLAEEAFHFFIRRSN